MSDLTAWLLEQIAEDEHMARRMIASTMHGVEAGDEEAFMHFLHPSRLLAECEAKRRIVQRCALVLAAFDDPERGAWPDVNRRERHHARITLEALALPLADRPGYREEWRP